MENKVLFPGVKDGETFRVGEVDFIKFPSEGDVTPVVAKDVLFNSEFGRDNNFSCSAVLKRMQEEILPKIMEVVGDENICPIQTDLTTLDGLRPYEPAESLIGLPTFNFYRNHVDIFDRYKVKRWWWLATPESAQPHSDPDWVVSVAPSGHVYGDYCNGVYDGVRPFLVFKSSIFGSGEM